VTEAPAKLFQTPHGPMYALAADAVITRCLEAYGEWSAGEWKLLAQVVKPGMTVVEVGANIGVHTIPLARACHPGTLYAFEPQPAVFELLRRNLAANAIGNVVARAEACGAAPGQAGLPPLDYARAHNFGGVSLLAPDDTGATTPVVTVDSLGLDRCGLLKVDVEGWEGAVLQGASETIRRCRPRLYVENDRREHQQALISQVAAMGYRLYWHTPPLISDAVADNIFGQRLVSVNMLCLPQERPPRSIDLRPIDPQDWTHPLD
jgi:FkbM family methyltransferase